MFPKASGGNCGYFGRRGGVGQMGNGIAHVFAQHAYPVRLYDVSEAQVARALKTIEQNLGRQAKKEVFPASRIPEILGRITVARDLSEVAPCDLVVAGLVGKLGTHHPLGPLALADFIGLDTVLALCHVLYDGFKDAKYRPCPLRVRMVQAGYLGKKIGPRVLYLLARGLF